MINLKLRSNTSPWESWSFAMAVIVSTCINYTMCFKQNRFGSEIGWSTTIGWLYVRSTPATQDAIVTRIIRIIYIYTLIYTWNPNDLYFWRSTPQNKAQTPIKTRGPIWVPGIYIYITFWVGNPNLNPDLKPSFATFFCKKKATHQRSNSEARHSRWSLKAKGST